MLDKNKIINMRERGMTYQNIADNFSISRQRVEQIINKRKSKSLYRYPIMVRDNYTCRMCGKKFISDELEIHHADKNTNNNDYLNLITVCINCHKDSHKKK